MILAMVVHPRSLTIPPPHIILTSASYQNKHHHGAAAAQKQNNPGTPGPSPYKPSAVWFMPKPKQPSLSASCWEVPQLHPHKAPASQTTTMCGQETRNQPCTKHSTGSRPSRLCRFHRYHVQTSKLFECLVAPTTSLTAASGSQQCRPFLLL